MQTSIWLGLSKRTLDLQLQSLKLRLQCIEHFGRKLGAEIQGLNHKYVSNTMHVGQFQDNASLILNENRIRFGQTLRCSQVWVIYMFIYNHVHKGCKCSNFVVGGVLVLVQGSIWAKVWMVLGESGVVFRQVSGWIKQPFAIEKCGSREAFRNLGGE